MPRKANKRPTRTVCEWSQNMSCGTPWISMADTHEKRESAEIRKGEEGERHTFAKSGVEKPQDRECVAK